MNQISVGARLANRTGDYTVISVHGSRARIRYDNGEEAEAGVKILLKIWEEIRQDRKVDDFSSAACWSCKHGVDTARASKCPACGWIICPHCGACGCRKARV